MPLCLAGGGTVAVLALSSFTLAWTHTVERIPWEEDWQIAGEALLLKSSRVKGSGAGMDPPPEARLVDGWYEWHPGETRRKLVLRRMPGIDDWRLCPDGDHSACRPVGEIVDADPVTFSACALPGDPSTRP